MTRLGLLCSSVILGVGSFGALACHMPNPAFDGREVETDALPTDGAEAADGSEAADSKGESGGVDGETGDGDPSETGSTESGPSDSDTGDGDGDPGDGDGDNTTSGDGDGDGEPDTTTTGDGDGDPIATCPNFEPIGDCQECAAENCCEPELASCFMNGTPCTCVIGCVGEGLTPLQCFEPSKCNVPPDSQLALQEVLMCINTACGNLCN